MIRFKSLCTAAALCVFVPVAATASTLLETQTVTFSGAGASGGQIISGGGGGGFFQNFTFTNDLSSLNIDRFVITLNVSGVGPEVEPNVDGDRYTEYTGPGTIGGEALDRDAETNSDGVPTENWFAEVAGGGKDSDGNNLGSNSAFWARLAPDQSPLEPFIFELSAANDVGENGSDRTDGIDNRAFINTVWRDTLTLRFRERSGGTDDQFELSSATVEVYEAAPIPLPASGLLLLGAVGGIAAWGRRKASS